MRYVAVTRGISSVNPPRIIYLRAVVISSLVGWGVVIGSSILVLVFAVVISILVEWGVIMGSPILVWGPAVATFSTIGWGEVFPRGWRVEGDSLRGRVGANALSLRS